LTVTFIENIFSDITETAMGASPTGIFTLKAAGVSLTEGAGAANTNFTVAYSNKVFTITVGAALAANTVYEITVVSNKIFDVKGNALATQAITFTTGA
jgi:hypothetical protein